MTGKPRKGTTAGRRVRAAVTLGAAFLSLAVAWAAFAALSPPADAGGGGFGGMVRPGIVDPGRAIVGSSRVSRHVLRPKLQVVREKEAGSVTELRMSEDRALLFVVLEDGSARLWDLERGVQLGGPIGGDVVTGVVRGDARSWEAIAVRRDGSSISLSPDGAVRRSGDSIPGLDPRTPPALSADGNVLAFRAADGGWRLAKRSAERLPGIEFERRPVLAPDGSKAFPLFGCGKNARATVGAYTPDGRRIAFGDRSGNVCVWDVPTGEKPRRLFLNKAHSGRSVRALAVDGDGRHMVTGGADGKAVVWSIEKKIRREASFALETAASGPLLLDVARGWVFAGEEQGTVGIHSIKEERQIARLISTDDGWAVVDREGRFDGPQDGVAALLWAGETKEREMETLPVDAFSERYFEPGLLAKIDDPAPPLLNEEIYDLPEEGFVMPPAVSFDPIDPHRLDASGRLSVTVRIEEGYRLEDVSEIRLYHDGKLVGQAVPGAEGEGTVEYAVSPLPGENTFAAVGVGPEGIEGRPASTSVTVADEEPPTRPGMRVVAVGINDYVRPSWGLQHARNDVKAVVAELRRRGGALFRGVDAEALVDSSASASAIEDRILRRSPSHRDILVVYLAGHGYALREGDGWEWYFLPFTDAWGGREVGKALDEGKAPKDAIRRHGLSSRRLMKMLTGTGARRVFLVLDSCRSGAVVDSVVTSRGRAFDDAAGQKALHRIARVGGIHVLAAARADEDAVELDSEPHGALTYLVLEGIRGGADDDRDGTISVKEIIAYASRSMPLLSRRLLNQQTVSHKPVGYSRGADFALAAGS